MYIASLDKKKFQTHTEQYVTLYTELYLRQTQQYTNNLAHISLCITEFIGRTMSLHVSAHGAIIRRYIDNLKLLNFAFYMDPYISLTFLSSSFYIHIECILYCLKLY
jgi:hypothetical protein